MAEESKGTTKRDVDVFASDPKSVAGKLKVRRDEQERRTREILSSTTTPDRLKPVGK